MTWQTRPRVRGDDPVRKRHGGGQGLRAGQRRSADFAGRHVRTERATALKVTASNVDVAMIDALLLQAATALRAPECDRHRNRDHRRAAGGGGIHHRAGRLPSVQVRHRSAARSTTPRTPSRSTRSCSRIRRRGSRPAGRIPTALFDESGMDVERPDRPPYRQHADRRRDCAGFHDGVDRRHGNARGTRPRDRHGRRSPSRRRRHHSERRIYARAERRHLYGSRRPD